MPLRLRNHAPPPPFSHPNRDPLPHHQFRIRMNRSAIRRAGLARISSPRQPNRTSPHCPTSAKRHRRKKLRRMARKQPQSLPHPPPPHHPRITPHRSNKRPPQHARSNPPPHPIPQRHPQHPPLFPLTRGRSRRTQPLNGLRPNKRSLTSQRKRTETHIFYEQIDTTKARKTHEKNT